MAADEEGEWEWPSDPDEEDLKVLKKVWKREEERKKEKEEQETGEDEKKPGTPAPADQGPSRWSVFCGCLQNLRGTWKIHVYEEHEQWKQIKQEFCHCMAQLIMLLFVCGLGGLVFRFTEGAFEAFYKCGVKRVKRNFIDDLWNLSRRMNEDEWKSLARRKLMVFEDQLHDAFDAGVNSYSGIRSWSFVNAVVYCLTVVTTIGYGHIAPTTTTGRVITIVYAIFGIPIFLILLADFGKVLTRGIKFLWAFVRRLYYTGSCKKVRSTVPVQGMMKGIQQVYDMATFQKKEGEEEPPTPDSPQGTFTIDDEFNLPISVAISILVIYIFFGAVIYTMWEEWSFFESFYFVFVSMSTIGFGDFVPKHPMFMMGSIIYLVFGLALTSMCINVVQEKLTDTFRMASVKLGATIGLGSHVGEDTPLPDIDEEEKSEPQVELAGVHGEDSEKKDKKKT